MWSAASRILLCIIIGIAMFAVSCQNESNPPAQPVVNSGEFSCIIEFEIPAADGPVTQYYTLPKNLVEPFLQLVHDNAERTSEYRDIQVVGTHIEVYMTNVAGVNQRYLSIAPQGVEGMEGKRDCDLRVLDSQGEKYSFVVAFIKTNGQLFATSKWVPDGQDGIQLKMSRVIEPVAVSEEIAVTRIEQFDAAGWSSAERWYWRP